MTDREKAIKGLECCGETMNCNECPYDSEMGGCFTNLKADALNLLKEQEPDQSKYEYQFEYTDCLWYGNDDWNLCPSMCSQYRDGWNDAMDYVFKNGKGYKPYVRETGKDISDERR